MFRKQHTESENLIEWIRFKRGDSGAEKGLEILNNAGADRDLLIEKWEHLLYLVDHEMFGLNNLNPHHSPVLNARLHEILKD